MATRDPHIISITTIPTVGGHAIVHEKAGEQDSKFQVMNPEEIPAAFLSSVLDQARQYEKGERPDREKSV